MSILSLCAEVFGTNVARAHYLKREKWRRTFSFPSVVGVLVVDNAKADMEQLGHDTFIIGHDRSAVCSTCPRSQYECSFRI